MLIVVCCNDVQKEELLSYGINDGAELTWVFEKVRLLFSCCRLQIKTGWHRALISITSSC